MKAGGMDDYKPQTRTNKGLLGYSSLIKCLPIDIRNGIFQHGANMTSCMLAHRSDTDAWSLWTRLMKAAAPAN